jgi:hypothetical protein
MRMLASCAGFACIISLACGGSGSSPRDYAIGERVQVPDYPDIIVTSFERTSEPTEVFDPVFQGEEVEPNEEYLVVEIQVFNDTDEPAGLNDFTDLTFESRGKEITDALQYVVGVRDALDADTLPPGGEAAGRVAWNTREGFDDLQLVYRPGTELFQVEKSERYLVSLAE